MTTAAPASPLLEETIEIAASPEAVWALVSDPPRMASWSPQVVSSRVSGGAVRLGARTVNLNRRGLLVWPTRSYVVRFEPPRELAFRIAENGTVWGFRLEPTDAGGTLLRQTREAPDGISPLAAFFARLLLGGEESFTEELRTGMRRTLGRIRDEAERLADRPCGGPCRGVGGGC
jgi:uncharacterized protein YndB with AHSA1/START domain